jgi:hypothetical protein
LHEKPEESRWGAATLLIGVLIYLFSRKEIPKFENGPPTVDKTDDTP